MSQMFGTTGQRVLTDREIAEDILTSHKYLSNYYYAPAILESMDPGLRSTFQQIHNDTQSEAKQVFDYLNARGWYRPRQADAQAMTELRNIAEESRQIVSALSSGGQKFGTTEGVTGQTVIGQTGIDVQTGFGRPATQGMAMGGTTGGTWGGTAGATSVGQTWQSTAGQGNLQAGTGWQPSYSQPGQWTGTQSGEGQSGMGPSSVAQWARWGGQPSWTGLQSGGWSGHGGITGGTAGAASVGQTWQSTAGQSNLQAGTGWQPSYSQPGQWTGTQAGEGQSGMGPSSVAQWARWGGQPSWTGLQSGGWSGHGGIIGGTAGAASAGQTWQSAGQSTWQAGTGWQPSYSHPGQWTGTQAGEGQSGMGPSSLAQWARWGGQPSWTGTQSGSLTGQTGVAGATGITGGFQSTGTYAQSDIRNRELS
ncbi:MAG TPA: hypothetical protein GXX30_01835 [Firmicutes bacterium]|nr:hypothetical protein [Candidatus Fermentithermobacillaceae bacterium]